MIRSFSIFVLILLSQAGLSANEDLYFSGSLESGEQVNLYLRVNERNISGWFRLNSEIDPRPLSGERSSTDNAWVLVEKGAYLQDLSRFSGVFKEGRYIGQWVSQSETLVFDLQLRMEVAEISLHRDDHIHIQVQYPYFIPTEEKEALNQTFFEEAMEELSSFYDWMDPETGNGIPFLNQVNVAAEYLGPQWISLIFESYQYTGGAHGNSLYRCRSFQKRNDEWKEVELQNLLRNPAHGASLQKRVIEALIDEGAGWIEEMIPDESFLKHYTLSPRGISFYFQPYDVGAYAEGSYRVFIPWDENLDWWDRGMLQSLGL